MRPRLWLEATSVAMILQAASWFVLGLLWTAVREEGGGGGLIACLLILFRLFV